MTDPAILLERFKPRLAYDSLEAYFADSAAIWTDAPTNVLRRSGGATPVKRPQLSLAFLGPKIYGDGTPTSATDAIGDTDRDYARTAAAMHKDPRYANRAHARARRDASGHLWLQYWLFYFYNDFQVLGPLLDAGDHEGDWELVQYRLGADERPDTAMYSQHATSQSKPWSDVPKAGPDTPLVYVARGSHANYFSAGSHWTGVWWDQADGKGPRIVPALIAVEDALTPWVKWPGSWGDTKSTGSPLDSNSPRSPGLHTHWGDPAATASTLRPPPPPHNPPPPPTVSARRDGDRLLVKYAVAPDAHGVVLGVRPAGSDEPARTVALPAGTGEIAIEHAGLDAGPYEVQASASAPDGAASPVVRTAVGPA